MPCLACDCDAIPLDTNWVLRTNPEQANLGHMPCKGKNWDSYFPDVFVNYKNGKVSCQECFIEVPKSILDKALFISSMFREAIDNQKEWYKQEIDKRLQEISSGIRPSLIIHGDNIEQQCDQAIDELRNPVKVNLVPQRRQTKMPW